MRGIVIFIMAFQLLSCQGKNQEKENCSKENAYNKITQIPEVSKAINTYKTGKQQIVFTIFKLNSISYSLANSNLPSSRTKF